MTATYRCWDNDNEYEEEGHAIEAGDEEEAAEIYAEHCYHEESFESIDIHVKSPSGATCVVHINAELGVAFSSKDRRDISSAGTGTP
jgi:hypothetical protein